jgi:hypothetical protein
MRHPFHVISNKRPLPRSLFRCAAVGRGSADETTIIQRRGGHSIFDIVLVCAVFAQAARGGYADANDYPTTARVDYVLGCMAANGNTREALFKCSCAIDTIASLMSYFHYEQAETALSLQAGGGVGGRVGLFRDPPQIKAVIEELRRAQAEANLQCR